MRSIRLAAAALIVCAALSACGQGGTEGSAAPTGAAVTNEPIPDPSVSPTGLAPTTPPADPTPTPTKGGPTTGGPTKGLPTKGGPTKPPPSGATTLTGTVEAGVEPKCVLLDGNLLVGGPRDVLKPGARVTVTGHPEPGLMTTCQQGTPFVVESARPA